MNSISSAPLVLTESDVDAVIRSMIATTLGLSPHEIAEAGPASRIDSDGLGADSLDVINLARQVGTFFGLYETGAEEHLLQRRTIGGWTRTVLEACDGAALRITFRTSGSTGEPEDCPHRFDSLVAEIDVLAELFAARTRIVGLVPRHHIYGFLFTVLLRSRLHLPFVDVRDASIHEVHRTLAPGDLLVGFPLRFETFASAASRFVPGVVAVTSTGPCRPAIVDRLRALGLEAMFEIYGSSQTGGIAWRSERTQPYRLFPYYSFAPGGEALVREGARVSLPDRLQRRGEGFEVVGRYDGAVSVAGVNVFPTRIAATIRAHPEVDDCHVRPMRGDEGERLKAFVVLSQRAQAQSDAPERLRRWLAETFSAPECPKPVTFGLALPRDAQGKAVDW